MARPPTVAMHDDFFVEYEHRTTSSVLTSRMLEIPRTETAYGDVSAYELAFGTAAQHAMRCADPSPVRAFEDLFSTSTPPTSLRACYAMSGTEIAHGGIVLCHVGYCDSEW
eukprot:1320845-Rhodomonas_salina.4